MERESQAKAIHESQAKAIEALRDWSKWVIGLDFFTGTGCVVVLAQGVSPTLKLFLVTAILLVALSALAAVLVVGILAALVQKLPLYDEVGAGQSIYDYPVWQGVTLERLVQGQFGLFALGIMFVVIWVMLKPPQPPAPGGPSAVMLLLCASCGG